MKRQRIIFLILTACFTFSLSAQNIDINTLKTINRWDVHGLSRGLSASGVILPVGIPTAMGLYALIKKAPAAPERWGAVLRPAPP